MDNIILKLNIDVSCSFICSWVLRFIGTLGSSLNRS